jgi:hypothetical protein
LLFRVALQHSSKSVRTRTITEPSFCQEKYRLCHRDFHESTPEHTIIQFGHGKIPHIGGQRLVLGRQPVTVCARVWMFHKSAKLKQFMQQMLGPRQDRVLRFDSAAASQPPSTISSRPRCTVGVVVNSTSKDYEERPKSEKLQTCHI